MMNYALAKKPKKVGDKESGEVWIALPQYEAVMSKEQFVDYIAGDNCYLKAEVSNSIMFIAKALRECLIMGYKIDLGELGKFSVKFDCKPLNVSEENADADAEEGDEVVIKKKYNPHAQIKDIRTVWEPTDKLKSLIDGDIQWKKVSSRRVQRKVNKANKNAQTTVNLSE